MAYRRLAIFSVMGWSGGKAKLVLETSIFIASPEGSPACLFILLMIASNSYSLSIGPSSCSLAVIPISSLVIFFSTARVCLAFTGRFFGFTLVDKAFNFGGLNKASPPHLHTGQLLGPHHGPY